jgi:hypothetical protein
VVPPVRVIERLASEAVTRAQRRIYQLLTAPLSEEQRVLLDGLLETRDDAPSSTLAWLKSPPDAPSARAVLAHIERLKVIRAIGLSADLGWQIHQNRLLRLAREGAQTAVYHLKDHEPARRYATLVAILLDTAATLTDEILDLHDRLIGSFFAKAKHKHERSFAEAGPAINAKVRLYAQIRMALIGAKEHGSDPFAAIEALMPWDAFRNSVAEAQALARDQDFDHLGLLTDHFGQLRRYEPTFLETFTLPRRPSGSTAVRCTPNAAGYELRWVLAGYRITRPPTLFVGGGHASCSLTALSIVDTTSCVLWPNSRTHCVPATCGSSVADSSGTSRTIYCRGKRSGSSQARGGWN